uniref:leucine-rich repeat domain-containing protein n=1 Tax=[Clostridium] hylemonae TaxID=89153 RepID=UPI001485FDE5
MMKCKERILALLLTSAMLLGMTAPVTAKAEAQAVPLERQIQSFSALTDGSEEKEVPQGTTWEELKLPGELEAMVLRAQEDGAETGGESTVSAPGKENVPVTWESRPVYDGETPGDYILTAAPGKGYTAPEEGSAPRITVRVKAVQTNAAQTNAGLKSAPTSQPPSTGTAFTVEVTGNGPDAVKNAVESAPGINDKERYTTITLTGDATELTGDNWEYLRSLYMIGNDWTNLTTLDLSGMHGLIKVEGLARNSIGRLTTVIFPDKLKTIGDNAFLSCGSLKNVVFPDGLRSIEGSAFRNCRSLTGAVFPSSLQTIGLQAFAECYSLTEVTFPKNLETVGPQAFSSCTSLMSFAVADGNGHFSSENGVLYDKKMETLLIYPIGNADTSFVLPDGVRTIKGGAFYDCLSLTKVIFPDSLETIEDAAFYDCGGLASLTFLGDRPPKAIGGNALYFIAGSGTIYYPAGKESNYNDTWKSGLSIPVNSDTWTLVPGYRLTVAGGTDTTKGGLYQENDSVSLTAAPSAG